LILSKIWAVQLISFVFNSFRFSNNFPPSELVQAH